MNQKVIFYIQSFKGSGLGHLKRSLNLATSVGIVLAEQVRQNEILNG